MQQLYGKAMKTSLILSGFVLKEDQENLDLSVYCVASLFIHLFIGHFHYCWHLVIPQYWTSATVLITTYFDCFRECFPKKYAQVLLA